jgi:hypothetical protein
MTEAERAVNGSIPTAQCSLCKSIWTQGSPEL